MSVTTHGNVTVYSEAGKLSADLAAAAARAMRKVGMLAETYAKQLCPVDTGLLRNSVAYAVGGEMPSTQVYTSDDGSKQGQYSGAADPDEENQVTVYVGTNVAYAPYVELGHNQQPGRYVPAIGKRLKAAHVPGKAFLRPALENHRAEYNKIIYDELMKAEQRR